jgi:hydrogenase maturation protein HypF
LGVAWDGAGFGTDGTIWGGEFLHVDEASFDRVAHFRSFRLPGGDAAARQPRRSALGLLFEMFGAEVFDRADLIPLQQFSSGELRMLQRMLSRGINSPVTSSAGRFFDAIASIVGLRQRATFEGQAAMDLETACAAAVETSYRFELRRTTPVVFDWQPMILGILDELHNKQPVEIIAAKVHNTLVELIVAVAQMVAEKNVVLTGGCFQNQYLAERTVRRLRDEGFVPHWHHRVPPNDGGIALGQIVAALRTAAAAHDDVGSKPDGRPDEIATELSEPLFKP